MTTFGMKVPYLWCDSHTSFNIKRSKVKVTRSINADRHRAPYLPNGKAYELQTWYTDGGQRPASATGAITSKVKGQSRKVTWSVWAVLPEIRHLESWRQNGKTRFSQKLSNLELLTTTYRKSYMGFSKNPLRTPKIQDGWDPPSWKSTWRLFSARCYA